MVFPKNILKSIIRNNPFNDARNNNNNNKINIDNNNNFKHYDQGGSPFKKPQAWNLSIPRLKEQYNDNNVDIDNQSTCSTVATSMSSDYNNNFMSPPPKSIRETISNKQHRLSLSSSSSSSPSSPPYHPHQYKKFTIHKDKHCPLPIVNIKSSNSSDSNPESPSAPWMPLSPPKASSNEQKCWNLTVPTFASPKGKKKRTTYNHETSLKQIKKQKITHRSRVMPMGDNSKSIVIDSYLDAQHQHYHQHHQPHHHQPRHQPQPQLQVQQPVLPTLPVISIDEDFPPTKKLRRLQHPPTFRNNNQHHQQIRSNSPLFYNENDNNNKHQSNSKTNNPLSHELIDAKKYDELLTNAMNNNKHKVSYTITKYLIDMYIKYECKKLPENILKEILQRCIYQQEQEDYIPLVSKIFHYYTSKKYSLEQDFLLFLTSINVYNEIQEMIMIDIIKLFLKCNPKLFYVQDSRRNTIIHLILKHQCNYPSTKVIQFILDLNSNNKKSNRHNSTSSSSSKNNKSKNLLLCKNDLKQYPLHLCMIKRRSISISSIKLLIEMSTACTTSTKNNSSFLFDKDSMGCTPINYLWMTRVDKDFHLKHFDNKEKVNHTYYKSLYQQSVQQLYHQKTKTQIHTLVDLLFGSTYVSILKWLLLSFSTYLHGIISLKEIHYEEIKLLLLLYPEQLLQKDNNNQGKTPMHYAAMKSADVLNIFLEGCNNVHNNNYHNVQAAVRITDDTMRLPLHHFIESSSVKRNTTPRVKIELVRKLLHIYPDSIEQCCSQDNTIDVRDSSNSSRASSRTTPPTALLNNKPFYPFMMAAENGNRDDDLDVIYTLLRMSPNLVAK